MNDLLRVLEICENTFEFKTSRFIDDDLELIINAGIHALSDEMKCNMRYHTITDSSMIELITKSMKSIQYSNAGMPGAIIIITNKSSKSPSIFDTMVLQNMRIMATSIGISSRWHDLSANIHYKDQLVRMLPDIKKENPIFALDLGYKKIS